MASLEVLIRSAATLLAAYVLINLGLTTHVLGQNTIVMGAVSIHPKPVPAGIEYLGFLNADFQVYLYWAVGICVGTLIIWLIDSYASLKTAPLISSISLGLLVLAQPVIYHAFNVRALQAAIALTEETAA